MKNSLSKIILPIVLLIACSLPSKAQTLYEFSTITINPFARTFQISYSNGEYKDLKLERDQVKGDGDVSPALKEIEKMNSSKWELFNTSVTAGAGSRDRVYTFYLRRVKE